jgi:hypothetical protein
MSTRLFRVGFAVIVVALFGLAAVAGCKKKDSDPTTPTPRDTAPPRDTAGPSAGLPRPGPKPKPGPRPKPGPQDGSAIPSPPTDAPYFKSGAMQAGIDCLHKLRQMAIALQAAAELHQMKLPIGIADRTGRVGLSWRVAVLPYIEPFTEHENLYKQFKLDEPWDSEHNRKLIEKMPQVYAVPRRGIDTRGYTYFRSFTGPDAVMPLATGKPGQVVTGIAFPAALKDGASTTLLVADATEPVIWTKPDELPYDKTQPPPGVGGAIVEDEVHMLFCDLSVRSFQTKRTAGVLGQLINISDGARVDLNKLPR